MGNTTTKRLFIGGIGVLVTLFVGSTGFYLLGQGMYPFGECLYMTLITVSTVGYGEIIPLDGVHFGRLWAGIMIISGMGTLVYFGSTLIAMIVEWDLGNVRRRRLMQKAIESMKDHVIVCGVGMTGIHVVRELVTTKTPFVVIDASLERLEDLAKEFPESAFHYLKGDSTEDDVLKEAGIERARGIVCCLPSDKDNLFVTISARQFNRSARIVTRAKDPAVESKLKKAGADEVVSPTLIGGMRMVSVMIRPTVVEFLDLMLRDKDKNLRIEEVQLPPGSPLVGHRLRDTKIRKATDLLVIAARGANSRQFVYNPGPDYVLDEEATIVVLGVSDDVNRLRQSLDSPILRKTTVDDG